MDFKKEKRLKKLALSVASFDGFLDEIRRWSKTYGMPLWSKQDYLNFFESVRS